ncbi:4086_t:CDS:2, partial [Racocetra persica]
TKSQIMVKDEIIMFLISIVFSIFYAVADIGKDKDENWWYVFVGLPLIISLSYILLITLFLLSFILRIKNIKKSTQNNESLESESKRLKVVETEKIASYVFMIWINSVAIGVYYIFAFSVGGVLILIQYIRNESLMHKPNQLNIPKLVVDHAPNEDPDVSQTNSTNCFFGLFHSNKDSSLLSASNSLSPRESFRHSFRDSFRDSFINMKLPFTKIQIQVVQHQTSDFSDNITNDNHVHLETPAISNIS